MKYLALYENFITDLFKKSKKDDYVRDIFLPKAFEIGDHVRIKNKLNDLGNLKNGDIITKDELEMYNDLKKYNL